MQPRRPRPRRRTNVRRYEFPTIPTNASALRRTNAPKFWGAFTSRASRRARLASRDIRCGAKSGAPAKDNSKPALIAMFWRGDDKFSFVHMPIRSLRNIQAFGPKFLVVCPRCAKRAILEQRDSALQEVFLSCAQCDFARQWPGAGLELESQMHWFDNAGMKMGLPVRTGSHGAIVHLRVGVRDESAPHAPMQPLDNFRLWLQTPCAEENLWLLNDEHLVFLRNYLDYPVKNHAVYFGWELEANRAKYHERLQWVEPWLRRAENRGATLESIKALRRKLGTPL